MRRMYSEQELTKIIKEVSEAYIDELIEDGVFDTEIVDAVNDYLDNNPITPSDLDFSSIDFIAKTLSQTNANWSQSIGFSGSSGVTITNIYNRLEVIGNILYLVVNVKLTNDTAESVSMGTLSSGQLDIPEKYGSKIVDLKGNPVNQPAGSGNKPAIASITLDAYDDVGYVNYTHNLTIYPKLILAHEGNTTANVINVYIMRNATDDISVPANSSLYFTGRLMLTLL